MHALPQVEELSDRPREEGPLPRGVEAGALDRRVEEGDQGDEGERRDFKRQKAPLGGHIEDLWTVHTVDKVGEGSKKVNNSQSECQNQGQSDSQ